MSGNPRSPPAVRDAPPSRCAPGAPRGARARPARADARRRARDRGGSQRATASASGVPERPLHAVIEVRSPRFYRRLLRGSVGLCESYMDGLWDCEDLVALTRIAALNVSALDTLRRVLAPVLIPLQRWGRWLARNTPGRSRRRIAAHYDLGNELFSLFLDPTMMYSCAVFDSPEATLEEASLAKLELVCEKLDLGPQDHLLEIGTGWGGLAVYAARHRGCRVTTTTISREQHDYACQRVREAGLEDRVTVLLEDYRELRRALRQARVDRDDRGRRLAVLPDVLPPLLGAAGGRRRDAAAGDRDRRPRLSGREGRQELHQHLHLPRRLPALAGDHLALAGARDRLPPGPSGGHHRPLRHHAAALARALPGAGRRACRSSATTSASAGCGSCT